MKTKAAVVLSALCLAACGGDDAPTATSNPAPRIAGSYSVSWLIQFIRANDGLNGSFTCFGTLTIAQPESGAAAGTISGFSVVGSPCPPLSFDLTGTVQPDGSIAFISGGPRPPQGQCPAGTNVQYTGVVDGRNLSARGTASSLSCPGPGEGLHRFDYIVSGTKR